MLNKYYFICFKDGVMNMQFTNVTALRLTKLIKLQNIKINNIEIN